MHRKQLSFRVLDKLSQLEKKQKKKTARTSMKCPRQADEPSIISLHVYCFPVHFLEFAVFMQSMEKEPLDISRQSDSLELIKTH